MHLCQQILNRTPPYAFLGGKRKRTHISFPDPVSAIKITIPKFAAYAEGAHIFFNFDNLRQSVCYNLLSKHELL